MYWVNLYLSLVLITLYAISDISEASSITAPVYSAEPKEIKFGSDGTSFKSLSTISEPLVQVITFSIFGF